MDISDFDIFGQVVGVEGREEYHLQSTLLMKGWMINQYFG